MKDRSEEPAVGLDLKIAHINSVKANLALGRVVQAQKQLDERSLAGAVGSDERDPLSFFDGKAYIIERLLIASDV